MVGKLELAWVKYDSLFIRKLDDGFLLRLDWGMMSYYLKGKIALKDLTHSYGGIAFSIIQLHYSVDFSYSHLLMELGQMPQLYCDTPRIDLHGLNWVGVPSMITGCYGLIIRFDNYLELHVKFLQLKGWFLR